jgi:hypothetical protein
MRKTSSMLLLLLIAAAPTLYAARPTPGTPRDATDYTVLSGRVTIGTVGGNMIGIVVSGDQPENAASLHLFRFWTNDALEPFRTTLEQASVEYRGNEVVIMTADPASFYVFGLTELRFQAPRAPAGFTSVHYVGYGINHEIRERVSRVSAG